MGNHLKFVHPFALSSNSSSAESHQPSTSTSFSQASTSNSGGNQASLKNFLKPSTLSPAKAEKLTQQITSMIVQDLLPISFVEGVGFKQLMAYQEPAYVIPCRKAFTARIQQLYVNVTTDVNAILQSVSSVSLTTDCWTSIMNRT